MSKGPKFRETKPINFQYAKVNILKGLDDCITSWCNKKGVPEVSLFEWKNVVMEEKVDRIKHLKETSVEHKNSLTSLNNVVVKQALNDLHEKYVFTPIEKASNNIAIICKKFYISTLIKELGLNDTDPNANNTYNAIEDIQENSIIQRHCNYLSKLKLSVDDTNKCLPNIYWIPKLHNSLQRLDSL